jgi:hypothetical protein
LRVAPLNIRARLSPASSPNRRADADLGMHPETLRKKVRQHEVDSGKRPQLCARSAARTPVLTGFRAGSTRRGILRSRHRWRLSLPEDRILASRSPRNPAWLTARQSTTTNPHIRAPGTPLPAARMTAMISSAGGGSAGKRAPLLRGGRPAWNPGSVAGERHDPRHPTAAERTWTLPRRTTDSSTNYRRSAPEANGPRPRGERGPPLPVLHRGSSEWRARDRYRFAP